MMRHPGRELAVHGELTGAGLLRGGGRFTYELVDELGATCVLAITQE